MKILFVSHLPLLYGAELCLYELVNAIKAAGLADPVVCFPREGPFPRRLRDLGISVWVLPYSHWASGALPLKKKLRCMRRNAGAVRRLRRVLEATAPDLVVTNTAVIPSAAIAAYSKGVPHVWCVHEYGEPGYDAFFHWGRGITWRLVGLLSRRVVVVSEGLRTHLSRWISSDRIRVVYPAVETPPGPGGARSATTTEPLRLVVIGHVIEGKGQEDAVRALAVLRDKGLSASLALVGSERPSYGAWLRKIATSLGVDGSIEFVGYVEDPFPYLREAHVVLVCSRREALGRVTIEAMKCGRPVVGADAAGTSESIQDGWNGLLYEPGNAGELASRIEALVRDPDLARRLVDTARAWASSTFTTEKYAESFLNVASEVARKPSEGQPRLPAGETRLKDREVG